MNPRFRCEADHYGYGWWLSQHLGFDFNPISLRGFQHGWIWWDSADFGYKPGAGLDPNLNDFWGILVQDKNVELYLQDKGIYAKACGLPFLNFYQHYPLRGSFDSIRKGKILFVPTHSNPWNDYSSVVKNSILEFKESYGEISVMLGAEDYEKFKTWQIDGVHFYKGAGVNDVGSFYRMAEIFESHEYVVTDAVGSHICYALHCGAKVGIDKRLYELSGKKELAADTADNKKLSKFEDYDSYLSIRSIDYFESRFPGITIDGGLPSFNKPPVIAYAKPHLISKELGWELTYDCEKQKILTQS